METIKSKGYSRSIADEQLPSTSSSNLHADEYVSQSEISKLYAGLELGRADGAVVGDEIDGFELGKHLANSTDFLMALKTLLLTYSYVKTIHNLLVISS